MAELFGGGKPELRLVNPISADLDAMRPSVLPGLVEAARRNADRGFPDIAMFEVGPLYRDDTPEGKGWSPPGCAPGGTGPKHWREPARTADLYRRQGGCAGRARRGGGAGRQRPGLRRPAGLVPPRPGRRACGSGPRCSAHFGELHPEVLDAFDSKAPVAAFEVFLDAVPQPRAGRARPPLQLSVFQPIERDFAFVVDRELPAETLLRAARGVDRKLVTEIRLFDVYEGKGLPEGKKSLAITVVLQPQERTLTDAEIEGFSKRLVAEVEKATGGVLRG